MTTFIICLLLLVAAYFTYGKYVEKLFGADPNRDVPSKTCYDGVDYIPMPKWKTFLIQLLNIAGLGPIFGAVLGATYGPVAFLWITFGGILMGAVHDYFSGMISIENKGLSYPELIGKYLGGNVKQFMRWFSIVLMILVGAVFLTGPAGLLADMTQWNLNVWLIIILGYYIIATLLPIDKIIGKIYPLFGAVLLIMAFGIMGVLFFGDYTIPEMSFTNMNANAKDFPIFPTLFITIACGALSGFHATQSPLMARCMTNEMQGRPIFFGAMISESIIALVWAAIAMAFFGGVEALNTQLAEHGSNAAWAVKIISDTTLGRVGGILALLGVIAAPISTGDTAFRCARMIIADMLKINQKTLIKRIYICIPLFIVGFFLTQIDFGIIWRYFAWVNQTFAVVTLWAVTVYLFKKSKNYFITLLPAIFMTFITTSFFFSNKIMLHLDINLSYILAAVATIAIMVAVKTLYLKK